MFSCLLCAFMCGRTACTLAPDEVIKSCSFRNRKGKRRKPKWKDPPGGQSYQTSYNMAPGSYTPVLVSAQNFNDEPDDDVCERVVTPMKWGLTPSWHQGDPWKVQFETNNCRSESMMEKKTYKIPLERGFRCVILADGFYEWKTTKDGKQPYFFYFPQERQTDFPYGKNKCESSIALSKDLKKVDIEAAPINIDVMDRNDEMTKKDEDLQEDELKHLMKREQSLLPEKEEMSDDEKENTDKPGPRLLTIAGVYDIWRSSNASPPIFSYSLITVAASKDMDWCHHRMPAILSTDEEVQDWLDSSTVPLQKATSLIKPQVCLTHYAVSKAVNNSRYKSSDCVKPVDISKPVRSASSNLMMSWLKKEPSNKSSCDTPEKKTKL